MKNSDTLLFFYAHENEHTLELLVMVFNQNRENLLESVTLSNNCGIWFETSWLMFFNPLLNENTYIMNHAKA